MRLFLVFLSVLFTELSHAQGSIELSGTVRDKQTGEAIPFVNIGLRNHPIGTMAMETGEFRLNLTPSMSNDTILFSCIGYSVMKMSVSSLLGKQGDVKLEKTTFLLPEAIAKPKSAEEYVRLAVARISDNYADRPSLARGYYYEFTTENNKFLKFEEAVTSTYSPAYQDSSKSCSSILYGRSADDVATLNFMQSKNARKEKRAEKRGKKHEPMIHADDFTGTNSGPSDILGSDPIHDRPEFLDPKQFKHFKFSLQGMVNYGERKLLSIVFEQRKQIDHQKSNGKLYIDSENYAFVAIEYEGKIIIPALLKPVIAMAGIGISNPKYNVRVHYREYDGRWYLSSAHQDIDIKLSTTDMFRKNDHSLFREEQAYVVESIEFENIRIIPKEKQVKQDKNFEEQAQFKDPAFWDSYTPVRPKRLESYVN